MDDRVGAIEALLDEADALGDDGDHEAAFARIDAAMALCEGVAGPDAGWLAAWGLRLREWSLEELGRDEEALAVCDELVARFGDATEPRVRVEVSQVLWCKRLLLEDLDRAEEVPSIDEAFLARRDEQHDDELAVLVLFCLVDRAKRLTASGEIELALADCEDALGRFGESEDPELDGNVFAAVVMRARLLDRLGRTEESLGALDEILRRYGDAPDPALRDHVIWALELRARALEDLGRVAEALDAYDAALAIFAAVDEPSLRTRRAIALIDKAITLANAGHHDEAVVVLDSAVAVGPPETGIEALFYKGVYLCDAGRSSDASVLADQVATVLGDVRLRREAVPPVSATPSEAELAARLAEVLDGDCWLLFATGGSDEQSRAVMARRAVELYRFTEPWLLDDSDDAPEPVGGAVAVMRLIADGYALLASGQAPDSRRDMPLPNQLLSEMALGQFGVASWADELGHPLRLAGSPELAAELLEQQGVPADDDGRSLAPRLAAAVRHYEMLELLCDSQTGQQVLRSDRFGRYIGRRIWDALYWTMRSQMHDPRHAGAAFARLLIAEACFLASQGAVPSSSALFPSRSVLRQTIREDGDELDEWLDEEGVSVPDWLAIDDAE